MSFPRPLDATPTGSLGPLESIKDDCEAPSGWPLCPSPKASTCSSPIRRSELLLPHTQLRVSDYYDLGNTVGKGTFGTIRGATIKASSSTDGSASYGACVAIKSIPFSDNSKSSTALCASFELEAALMASLEHPHILRMHECFREAAVGHLVLELCSGGDLFTRITSQPNGNGLDEPFARDVFIQMLDAVGYLHARRIVHNDLKTENFLFLGKQGTPLSQVLKLCDFGSCDLLSNARPRSIGRNTTLSYTAPELHLGRGGAEAADMWSLGVVLYVTLTGTNPFKGPVAPNSQESIEKIREAAFDQRRSGWVRCSSTAQDLVKRLLVVEEEKRYTCAQACTHRWLASSERPLLASGIADPPGLAKKAPKLLARLQMMARLPASQRAMLAVYALAATSEDLEPCRQLFLSLDRDKDGQLSSAEFCKGLRDLLCTAARQGDDSAVVPESDQELNTIIAALDVDGSRIIEWSEFAATTLLELDFSKRSSRVAIAARLAAQRPPGSPLDSGFEQLGEYNPHIRQWLAPVVDALEANSRTFVQREFTNRSFVSREDTMMSTSSSYRKTEPGCLGLVVTTLNDQVLLVGVADPERLTLKVMSKMGAPFLGCAAVKAWNEACVAGGKPNMVLEVDQCIIQVNGVRGNSSRMMELLFQAARTANLDVDLRIVSVKKVEAMLHKAPGQTLGMQVRKKGSTAFALEVEEIDQVGLVKDWNEANPKSTMKAGSIIVAVSGFRGLRQDLLKEVARQDCSAVYLTLLDLSIYCL